MRVSHCRKKKYERGDVSDRLHTQKTKQNKTKTTTNITDCPLGWSEKKPDIKFLENLVTELFLSLSKE